MRALLLLVVICSSIVCYGAPRPKNDSTIEQHIQFKNQDAANVLRAFGWFKNGFSLHDASIECAFDSVYPVGGLIALNGGTLVLNTDMRCDRGTRFATLGRIVGNNRSLNLGVALSSLPNSPAEFQDLSISFNSNLALHGPITIKGKCEFHGNGNILQFMPGSQLVVDAHAVLELHNVVLEGVDAQTIVPRDETSTIVVRSVIGHVQQARYVLSANKTRFIALGDEGAPDLVDGAMPYTYRFNQSQLDSIAIESCCTGVNCAELLDSKIDACCQAANSRLDVLESKIDACCTGTAGETCSITISGRVYWDPVAHPEMQPQTGQATVFKFTKCWGPIADIPTLVFDPAVYGNGGVVELPPSSRILFVDQGIVEVHDGVIFDMQGTDPAVDIPRFIVEERALLEPVEDAVVTFGGVGEINIRDAGGIFINKPAQIVIGRTTDDLIDFVVEGVGTVVVDNLENLGSPTAFVDSLLTFQLGTTNVIFDDQAILRIGRGVVEFNTNNGLAAAGVLNTLNFIGGSSIEIQKVGEESGVLRFSPNRAISGVIPGVSFNNRTGQVFGGGNMQLVTFGGSPVNALLQVQPHYFVLENRTMQELFMTLGYLQWPQDQPTNVEPSDAEIVVRFGVVLNDAVAAVLNNPEFLPVNSGLMAALRVSRNGSAVPLQPADHDIAYNNEGLIVGYDINNNYFGITSGGVRTNR